MNKAKRVKTLAALMLTAGLVLSSKPAPAGETGGVKLIPLNAEQRAEIKRHLLPLPKEIEITNAVLASGAVNIYLPAEADPLVREGAEEIARALRSKGAARAEILNLQAAKPPKEFAILLGRADVFDQKASLPKSAQGYVIQPLPDAEGLLLKGNGFIGTLYAARTLVQLLQKRDDGVLVPLARIKDWPDLEERGFRVLPEHMRWMKLKDWKGLIDWMAARKFNVLSIYAFVTGDKGFYYKTKLFPLDKVLYQKAVIAAEDLLHEIVRYGKKKGLKMVMTASCYDYYMGIVEHYPEIEGVGSAQHRQSWPCFAKKATREFLTSLYSEMIDHMKPDRLEVRLSENHDTHCTCESCKENHWVKEARVTWEVFREISEKRPGVELEIQLTQGSYPENYEIITSLPKSIFFNYYDGGRTYTVSDGDKIYGDLEKAVGKGYRIAVYPSILPLYAYGTGQMPLVDHLRILMNEFVEKRLFGTNGRGAGAYAICRYNMNHAALAEFSWHAKGRSAEEAFVAWAATEGYERPEEFGRAYALLDQAARHVFLAGLRRPKTWRKAVQELVKEKCDFTLKEHKFLADLFDPPPGKLRPDAPYPKWASSATPYEIYVSLPARRKPIADALAIAERIGSDRLIHECRLYDSCISVMENIIKLSELRCVQGKPLSAPETAAAIKVFKDALRKTAAEREALLKVPNTHWNLKIGLLEYAKYLD